MTTEQWRRACAVIAANRLREWGHGWPQGARMDGAYLVLDTALARFVIDEAGLVSVH